MTNERKGLPSTRTVQHFAMRALRTAAALWRTACVRYSPTASRARSRASPVVACVYTARVVCDRNRGRPRARCAVSRREAGGASAPCDERLDYRADQEAEDQRPEDLA